MNLVYSTVKYNWTTEKMDGVRLPSCPGCFTRQSHHVLSFTHVPANCSALWPTREAAQTCKTGSIELRACNECGLRFNAAFDPELLDYDTQYDNSLDFSPTFQAYTEQLLGELCERYGLRRKQVIGVGCGNGNFLAALCRYGQNEGHGYDPSYSGDLFPMPGVEFTRGYFTRREAQKGYDFLSCRHVLEHLDNPLEFLRQITDVQDTSSPVIYIEVPNGEHVLTDAGLWDIIYPHVSYFTQTSLVRLVESAGLEVISAGKRFSNQFLFVEARVSRAKNGRMQDHAGLGSALLPSFGSAVGTALQHWSDCLAQLSGAGGGPIAFWGAGAKGVTFLNLVPGAREIPIVVDLNPKKQGMHVPGTGQLIRSPGALEALAPKTVILLNPAYRGEIEASLIARGISAQIVTQPVTLAS